MGSISRHVMPLVINSLGGGQTRILTFVDKAILRNQARAGRTPGLTNSMPYTFSILDTNFSAKNEPLVSIKV